MKKNYFQSHAILFLILCFVSTSSIAQKQGQAKIDSLKTDLKTLKEDTNKVNTLNILAWEFKKKNPDTALVLSNQALILSEKIKIKNGQNGWQLGIGQSYHNIGAFYNEKNNDTLAMHFYLKALDTWEILERNTPEDQKTIIKSKKIKTLFNIGLGYGKQNNYSQAIDYHTKALRLAEELGDKERVAKNLTSIGSCYLQQGNLPKATEYILKALKIYKEIGNKENIAINLGNVGTIYWEQGDYPKALDYDLQTLKIYEEINNRKGQAEILVNIGLVYKMEKDYVKALDFYLKALKIDEEQKNEYNIALCLGNIGGVYDEMQKDHSQAFLYYSRALKIEEKIGDKQGVETNAGNLGVIFYQQQDYPKALYYYFKALKIAEEIGDIRAEIINLDNIGSLYTDMKKYPEAEKYFNKSLTIAEGINALDDIKVANQNLSEFYEHTGNYSKALSYFKKAIIAKDSIFNEAKTKEFTRNEMNYEFNKQQDSVRAVQDKKDALTKAEISKQKVIRNSIAGGAGVLGLSAILSFFFYKRKRDAEQYQKETSLSLQVSETEMKALRSQMNPHFIFNALQSIQTFLLNNKSEDANTYLLKFSKLMRLVLENSQHSEVSLKEDMLALELYMQLESIRLPHPFTYEFHIDESLDMENTTIPPLILQPFVENAIWHGLQYKPESGRIDIYISERDNTLYATVEDNGVGRDMSKKAEHPMLLKKESLGMKLTEERLKILNELKKIKAQFMITDLFTSDNKPAGTKVELSLPLVS